MNLGHSLSRLAGMVVCIVATTMPASPSLASDDTNHTGFVLELGNDVRTIQLTPEYKEAALKATLPIFSDFAQKLHLPVPLPLTRGDIINYVLTPFQRNHGEIDSISIETKEGLKFTLFGGIVRGFTYPNTFSGMQDVHTISHFFGTAKITQTQAVQAVRETLSKIGIPPEDLFAEQEPHVELPTWGTNTIARYIVTWRDPRGNDNGPVTVKAEVNAESGRVEGIHLLPENGLKKDAPKVEIAAPAGHDRFDAMIPPSMSPDYAGKLIPIVFTAIDEYAQKLALPISVPLTTNNVAKVQGFNNEGWPQCEIWLTNGWHFVYRHTMVNGFYAPNNFFDSDNRKIHIRDFDGKWNLTTNQAIVVVRLAMTRLNYPTNNVHMDFAPSVYTASLDKEHIPRLRFEWYYSVKDELQSRLEAEVNMDNGTLESLYYDDKAYWESRPPIAVPISTVK